MPDNEFCYYNDDFAYNGDWPYNGNCPPDIIPTEALLRLGRRKQEKKRDLFFCEIKIDILSVTKIINDHKEENIKFNKEKIDFKCEEDLNSIPQIVVDSIKIMSLENEITINLNEDISDTIEIKENDITSPIVTNIEIENIDPVFILNDIE